MNPAHREKRRTPASTQPRPGLTIAELIDNPIVLMDGKYTVHYVPKPNLHNIKTVPMVQIDAGNYNGSAVAPYFSIVRARATSDENAYEESRLILNAIIDALTAAGVKLSPKVGLNYHPIQQLLRFRLRTWGNINGRHDARMAVLHEPAGTSLTLIQRRTPGVNQLWDNSHGIKGTYTVAGQIGAWILSSPVFSVSAAEYDPAKLVDYLENAFRSQFPVLEDRLVFSRELLSKNSPLSAVFKNKESKEA